MKTPIGRLMMVGLAASFGAAGCLSMQSQTTLDAIEGAMSNQPFVEAYVEYAGPQARWAGPTSFILHVMAKDAGAAQISVTPALFDEINKDPTMSGRAPASQGYAGDQAREQLAHLATALQGAEQTFRGCLSPVRVRLIRADGSILEKHGCRGQNGWSRVASETVNNFITAALFGVTNRVPASAPAAAPATGNAGAGAGAAGAVNAAGAAGAASAAGAATDAKAVAAEAKGTVTDTAGKAVEETKAIRKISGTPATGH